MGLSRRSKAKSALERGSLLYRLLSDPRQAEKPRLGIPGLPEVLNQAQGT
jgi:hypothetical protein